MLLKKHGILFIVTICVLSVFSCKKKKLDTNSIRIATVNFHQTNGYGYNYRVVYDEHSNVDSIIGTGTGAAMGDNTLAVFTYAGTSIRVTDASGQSYLVTTNTNGMIDEVQKYDTLLMTYNGNQLDELNYETPSNTPPYYTLTTTDYQWNNGDITTFGAPHGAVDSYMYNNSRSGQLGDAIRINDFLTYGRPFKLTSHLPVALKYANGGEQYFYTFDGSGRISVFTKVVTGNGTPNDTSSYVFSYY